MVIVARFFTCTGISHCGFNIPLFGPQFLPHMSKTLPNISCVIKYFLLAESSISLADCTNDLTASVLQAPSSKVQKGKDVLQVGILVDGENCNLQTFGQNFD